MVPSAEIPDFPAAIGTVILEDYLTSLSYNDAPIQVGSTLTLSAMARSMVAGYGKDCIKELASVCVVQDSLAQDTATSTRYG